VGVSYAISLEEKKGLIEVDSLTFLRGAREARGAWEQGRIGMRVGYRSKFV
jgi:hypothetical protein